MLKILGAAALATVAAPVLAETVVVTAAITWSMSKRA